MHTSAQIHGVIWRFAAAYICGLMVSTASAEVPSDFPKFIVPGKSQEMESLRHLFWLHYASARPLIPLWDEWLPNATLWPAWGEGRRHWITTQRQ